MLPALPVLAQLVFSNDDEVLADGCWALLPQMGQTEDQAVLDTGICARIVELMGPRQPPCRRPRCALPATWLPVTIARRSASSTAERCRLLALLSSPKKGIRKEACWTISNITAGRASRSRRSSRPILSRRSSTCSRPRVRHQERRRGRSRTRPAAARGSDQGPRAAGVHQAAMRPSTCNGRGW